MIPVMLGLIAKVTMPGLVDPETVIPELAIAHLHPVAIAIFVGALLAAIMSTADSALLATASIFSNNILPLFKPQASDRLRLLATRVAIPIFGSIAIYVALPVRPTLSLPDGALHEARAGRAHHAYRRAGGARRARHRAQPGDADDSPEVAPGEQMSRVADDGGIDQYGLKRVGTLNCPPEYTRAGDRCDGSRAPHG